MVREVGLLVVCLLLALRAPPWAASPYTVTLTADQDEALKEYTSTVNGVRARVTKGSREPLTPAQVLQGGVDRLIEDWDKADLGAAKPWTDKTPREKRRHCERHGMNECPK